MIGGEELSEYVSDIFEPEEVAVYTGLEAKLQLNGDKRTGGNALGALKYNLEQENTLRFEAALENSYLEVRCTSTGTQTEGYNVELNGESMEDIDEIEREIKKLEEKPLV